MAPAISFRECSKHSVQLFVEKIAVWAGVGTEANPHRIDHWVDSLICPIRGCEYLRALKNPYGDRTDNRKTERARLDAILKGERSA